MKRPKAKDYYHKEEYIHDLEYYIDYLEDTLEDVTRNPVLKNNWIVSNNPVSTKEWPAVLKSEFLDPEYMIPYNPNADSIDELLDAAKELWKDVETVPKKERRIPVNITVEKMEKLGWNHTKSKYECDQNMFYFPKCAKGWSYWLDIRDLDHVYMSFDENDGTRWFAPRYKLEDASIEDSIQEIEKIMEKLNIIKITNEKEI